MAFALTPASALTERDGLPGSWIQFKQNGVDVGAADVDTIDFVAGSGRPRVTRGVGSNAHVVTVFVADEEPE